MKSKLTTKAACRPQYDLEFKTPFFNSALEAHTEPQIIRVRYVITEKWMREDEEGSKVPVGSILLSDFIWLDEMMLTGINAIASNKIVTSLRSLYILRWYISSACICWCYHYSKYLAPTLRWMQNKAADRRTSSGPSDCTRKSTPGNVSRMSKPLCYTKNPPLYWWLFDENFSLLTALRGHVPFTLRANYEIIFNSIFGKASLGRLLSPSDIFFTKTVSEEQG